MSIELAPTISGAPVRRWKRYPAYRDSRVEWIGEVPEGWNVLRLKKVAHFGYGNSLAAEDRIPGDYYVYGSNGIVGKHEQSNTKEPCLIIGRKGSFGKVVYSEKSCFAIDTTYFVDSTLTNNNLRWLFYCLQWLQLDSFSKDSAVPGLAREDAYQNLVPFCSFNEQHTIAAFLDRETGRIDTLIEKKERQIELLQEKRAALISHVVTKGLDPDVKMKDSGVEWLEEVPVHWDETITSALFMDNKKKNKGAKETNLLSLSYGNIIRKDINTNEGLLPETFEAYQILYPGYIVLRLTDLQNDKRSLRVGHANEKGIITSAYTGLRKKSDAVESSKYFYYLLHTYDIIKVFYGMGAGVRQSLNFNELRKLRLLLPPPEEQKAIAAFIDRETGRIDTLTTKIQESLSKLSEYRTALISAAVTGKIDVRQEVMT